MPLTLNMTHLSGLLPDVLPHAPEIPEAVVSYNARRAAIELCQRTRCWRYISANVVTAQDPVPVAPPNAAIFEIEQASFTTTADPTIGHPLEPAPFNDGALPHDDTDYGLPRYYTQAQANTVRLLGFSAGTLHMTLFLKPSEARQFELQPDNTVRDDYDVVPDFVFERFRETLVCGTLARILMHPNKPYSNPQLAAYHGEKFESALNADFSDNVRGQQRAPRRTRSRFI